MSQKLRYFVFGFWFLNCAGVFFIWILSLASGRAWERSILVYQDGNIPVFHLVAESGMAIFTLFGLTAWIRRKGWGPAMTLSGAGMFAYSGINSMGWAVHNSPGLVVPMAMSVFGLVGLLLIAGASVAGSAKSN